MTGYRRLLVVCLVALTTVTAVPYTNRNDKCVEAGELADVLFFDLMFPSLLPDFDARGLFTEVLDLDFDHFTFTNVFCPLEGVESIKDAIKKLHDTPEKLAFKAFKGMYDNTVLMMTIQKYWLLQNSHPSETVSDILALITALEASGITQRDPRGVAWMLEGVGPFLRQPPPQPLSTQPLVVQITDITNKIQKVWITMIKGSESSYGEQSGTFYRERVYNMTGIFMSAPGSRGPPTLNQWSRHILGLLLDIGNDMSSTFDLVYNLGIFGFMVSDEYTRIIPHVKETFLDDDGYDHSSDNVHKIAKELVVILNDMGLLDLQLMTDFYPYPGKRFVKPQ